MVSHPLNLEASHAVNNRSVKIHRPFMESCFMLSPPLSIRVTHTLVQLFAAHHHLLGILLLTHEL